MKTRILNARQLGQAAELIKSGEVVAFPTETVYGLGANALDASAVRKIFRAKGRPSDNPLIVHIADKKMMDILARRTRKQERVVELVTRRFWPGPLTIILRKTETVPVEVTGGLNTVAIRMPRDGVALGTGSPPSRG